VLLQEVASSGSAYAYEEHVKCVVCGVWCMAARRTALKG
jgi:hypothetical protein